MSPSGILYPGGYDTNTVGEILGRIESINSPESGPVQLQVLSGRDRYIILTAPVLYWKSPGERILGGMEILAKGSKALGADGKLYLIAQEIRNPKTGDTVVLRKEDGTPVWAERNFGASGRAEFGSSMRGGGGSMRGPGRGGHGRR